MPIGINLDGTLAVSQEDYAKSVDDFNKQQLIPTASKVQNLQSKAQEKTERLGGQTTDPTVDMYNEMNIATDKYGITKDSLNTYTPEQMQETLGKVADDRVYNDDPTIGAYQWRNDVNGNWQKVPYTGSQEHLYIAPSKDGNMKLGLAALGFKERYTPRLAEKEGYHRSDGKPFGYAPGAKGVDPTKDPYLDIALPANEAKRFEFLVHSNKGQVANRVGGASVGNFIRNKTMGVYGDGASEYTTHDAPMWNVNSTSSALPDRVVTAKAPKFYAEGEAITTKTDKQRLAEAQQEAANNQTEGYAVGLAKSTASSILSTLGSGVDALTNDLPDWAIAKGETAYYDHKIDNATTPDERKMYETAKKEALGHSYKINALTSWLHGDGYNDTQEYYKDGSFQQATDKALGVDTQLAAKEQKDVETAFRNGEYGKALWKAVTSRSIVGNIVGSVVTYGIGVGEVRAGAMVASKGSKIGQWYKEYKAATKAGEMAKAEILATKMGKEMNIAQKVAAKAIERAGATTMFTSTADSMFADRNKAQGQEHATVKDIAIVAPMAALETLVGLESAEIIMKPGTHEAIKTLSSMLSKDSADKLWKSVLKFGGRMAVAAGKGASVEGTEEYIQQWADILGRQWKTGKKGDNLASIIQDRANQVNAGVAGIEGMAGGHISMAVQGVEEFANRDKKAKISSDPEQQKIDAINEDIQAVNSWDGDPTAKVNEYIRAKRAGNPHDLTADQEKHVPGYIMAHIMQGNDQVKALQTLIDSPDVSEQDKIAHEATIEGLKSNIAQQWMAYNDVTNNDGTVLNNRPIEEINKDIRKIDEQIASGDVDKSQLEYQKKVLAVEKHIAEQLKLPEFEKLAKQLDKNVATDGVNTQGKQIAAHETLANKIYNGASDESGVKRGMLEYARILLNPNIPEEAKQGVIGEMNKFLNSQDRKEAAILAAKGEFEANGGVAPVSKPYGMYADGRTAEVEYRGKQTEGLVNSIVAENTLMKSIRDQIINEGQTNEQSSTTTGQNEPVQAGTENGTKTEEGSGTAAGQNEKGGSIREEAPTSQIDELPPEDTTQLTDKEKLLKGIDDQAKQVAQTEGITKPETDKRKAVLGKLIDKLYADHWKEDPKGVKQKIDELVAYKGDIAPDNVKWLKRLIEAKAEVKQAEEWLEDSKNETIRLQAKLDGTAKMVVDGLLRKIEPITKDYKARYVGTTEELTAKTKEANKQAKEVVGVGPFAGGKINTDKLIEGSQTTLKDKREKILQPIGNKIEDANSQLDSATANLVDSQDKLAKIQEGYNQSKSNNTVGAAVMKKHSRKEGEVNKVLAEVIEGLPSEFKDVIKKKAGCK